MTYSELLTTLDNPNTKYYHTIISNADIILRQVGITKSHIVAKDLNMKPSKFSIILSILRELADDQ